MTQGIVPGPSRGHHLPEEPELNTGLPRLQLWACKFIARDKNRFLVRGINRDVFSLASLCQLATDYERIVRERYAAVGARAAEAKLLLSCQQLRCRISDCNPAGK